MNRVALIAALTQEHVIGKENDLPWRLPDDLRLFKRLTTNHTVIMGRNTYDSIIARLKKPLPDRLNVVLSSTMTDAPASNVVIARTLDAALAAGKTYSDETFVIGGERVYALALPKADRMYLSWVDVNYAGDAFFPRFDQADWSIVMRNRYEGFEQRVYDRVRL